MTKGILNSLRFKKIKIRAVVVMFILVISIVAFNFSTAKYNVKPAAHGEKRAEQNASRGS